MEPLGTFKKDTFPRAKDERGWGYWGRKKECAPTVVSSARLK